MFDKLMFWKQEEPIPDPLAPQQSPLGPDPLQQQNPLGPMQHSPLGTDPLQPPGQTDPFQQPDPLQPAPMQNQPMGQNDPLQVQHPSIGETPPNQFGNDRYEPEFGRPPQAATGPVGMNKEIEILSAKMDALRASIESMNQRIINIENIAKQSQGHKQW